MNSSPRHPYTPRTSPYEQGGRPRVSRGFSPSSLPRPLTPGPRFYTPPPGHHHQYPSPPMPPPIFSTPPPWGGGFSPVSPAGQYFTPQQLPPSPLSTSTTPMSPYGTLTNQCGQNSSPTSFYAHPDMPSPMMPPQKRKRFTHIRGRGGRSGRHQHNRSFRGGRGRRGSAGIDAYYDPFMFEDPWRDLLSSDERTAEVPSVNVSVGSSDRPNDEAVGVASAEVGVHVGSLEQEPCESSNSLPQTASRSEHNVSTHHEMKSS